MGRLMGGRRAAGGGMGGGRCGMERKGEEGRWGMEKTGGTASLSGGRAVEKAVTLPCTRRRHRHAGLIIRARVRHYG